MSKNKLQAFRYFGRSFLRWPLFAIAVSELAGGFHRNSEGQFNLPYRRAHAQQRILGPQSCLAAGRACGGLDRVRPFSKWTTCRCKWYQISCLHSFPYHQDREDVGWEDYATEISAHQIVETMVVPSPVFILCGSPCLVIPLFRVHLVCQAEAALKNSALFVVISSASRTEDRRNLTGKWNSLELIVSTRNSLENWEGPLKEHAGHIRIVVQFTCYVGSRTLRLKHFFELHIFLQQFQTIKLLTFKDWPWISLWRINICVRVSQML